MQVGTKRKCLRISDTKRFNFSSTAKLLEVWLLSDILNAFYVSCSCQMGAGGMTRMTRGHPLSQLPKNREFKAKDCTGAIFLTWCPYYNWWKMTLPMIPKTQKAPQGPQPKGGERRSETWGILLNLSIKKYLSNA